MKTPASSPPPQTPTRPSGWPLAALGGILLVAFALRVVSAQGGLWLDEIWSLKNIALARTLPGDADWLALFFHDNTHALNTIYMAAIGPNAPALAYRGLSIVCGTASVAVAAAIGWRRSPREGLIGAAMVGLSYPLVHYAGEARGYAPMTLAVVAAFYLLERCLERPARGRVAAFIAVSLVGMASHLTFLIVEGALGVWAMVVLFRRREPVVRTFARLTVLFGVQAIVTTLYGAVAWNNMVVGGGAIMPVSETVDILARLTFGSDPAARGSVSLALGLGLGWTIWLIRRQGDMSWLFFALLVLAFPLGFAIVDPPFGMVPRYFIAAAPAALVLAARGLAALMTARRWTRAMAGGLLAVFVIANGLLLDKFFSAGRGDYAGAVRFIAANAGPGPARVAGYHQFHVSTTLTHTARKQGLAVRFVRRDEDRGSPAEWYIDRGPDAGPPPPVLSRTAADGGLTPFKLMAVFPRWGLSGDSWAVYRRTSNRRNPSAVLPGNGTVRIQSGRSPASRR